MSLDARRRTRHGAHVRRRNDRRTHDEVGGARSTRRLSRSEGRSLGVVGVSSDRAEPAGATRRARGAVTSLDARRRTRRGAHVRRRNDRRTHDEVGGARSTRRLARSEGRSLGVVGVGSDRAEPAGATRRARGAVTSLDARRRTRHGLRVRRRHDRRTHDEVGRARPARRLARGSALDRRRQCRLWERRAGSATRRAG